MRFLTTGFGGVWFLRTAVAVLLAGVPLLITGCKGQTESAGPPSGATMPAPVKVAGVSLQTVPLQINAVGTVEAVSTITVKTQIPGELVEVAFEEGDFVKKDQVLFQIDARPYQAALHQAEANLATAKARLEQERSNSMRDKAQARNAQVELDRDATLVTQGMVSKEEFDQVRTNAEALKAVADASEAAIKYAEEAIRGFEAAIEDVKLRLGYCVIRSPIDGRTGSLLVHRGNVVKANETELVVINQTAPIYVSFAVAEQYLSEIKRYMAQGPLEVKAIVPHEDDAPETGTLTFVDNAVDQMTGTIRLKATFDNANNQLWPGQFVTVALQMAVQDNATVVPVQAIQMGQSGSYVYVLKPDMTVELRNVVTGDQHDGLIVITEGLQAAEKVVTDGQLRLKPGAAVRTTSQDGVEGAPSA